MSIHGVKQESTQSPMQRDALTGALNREGFQRVLEQALSTPERHTALLLIAIADLSRIGDDYSASARVAVMREMGAALCRFESETVCVARVDEGAFAAVVRDHTPDALST